MESESEVRTILVTYNCDDCGGEVKYYDGNMLLSHPVKFKHSCVSCEKVYLFDYKYPYTKYIQGGMKMRGNYKTVYKTSYGTVEADFKEETTFDEAERLGREYCESNGFKYIDTLQK